MTGTGGQIEDEGSRLQLVSAVFVEKLKKVKKGYFLKENEKGFDWDRWAD